MILSADLVTEHRLAGLSARIEGLERRLEDEVTFAAMFGRLQGRHDGRDMDAICAFLGLTPMDLSVCAIEAVFAALTERAQRGAA